MAGMVTPGASMSSEEARALVAAERSRGHGGHRWHMRRAGEELAPARHLDPAEVDVRWDSDVIPGTESIVSVSFATVPLEEMVDLEDEPGQKRRPGRPKGSGNKAKKDEESRKRGQDRNRAKAAERREAIAASPKPEAAPESLPEMPAVPAAPVVTPAALAAEGTPVKRGSGGQTSEQILFGEEFWRETINGLPRNQQEAAA